MRYVAKQFKVQPYGYWVEVVLTDNAKVYCKEEMYEDLIRCPCALLYDFRQHEDYPVDFRIVMRTDHLTKDTLVHETFHLTARIMRYIGTPLVEDTEEPYAYLQDYLFKVINSIIFKLKEQIPIEDADRTEEGTETVGGLQQVETGSGART